VREEVRETFRAKGPEGADLERAVDIVTSDRRRRVETMLVEELGLALRGPSPVRAPAATFTAFLAVGLVPLLPFVADFASRGTVPAPFAWSTALTAAAFFGIGAAKSLIVERTWYRSGAETLLVGGRAAALAYMVGALLRGIA
jgi:VIT1/CCC1 family predicted Fe2+/Mn2+ transporter